MKIYRNNIEIADVWLQDNSHTSEEIKGEHTALLAFDVLNPIDFTINDYIVENGSEYSIRHKEKVKKEETSLGYNYSITFYHEQYKLQDVAFFLFGKRERKKNFDTFTGTALQVLNLVVKCLNQELGGGWKIGSCIETSQKTYNFKDMQCSDVINRLCSDNETEFWVESKTISLGRREYASNGLVLGQGEGFGFKSLELSAVDDTPPFTVIYPYGGDKNLGSDYGADYLLLPDGLTELTKNVDKYGRRGKHVQFEHIFPKGEFAVTAKIDNFTLKASGIDFNLTDCLLDGVEIIVTFQNGSLAGYDLAIMDGSWDNITKQFKLKVNEQENALKVPGDINFVVGDKFILTGLKMPESYKKNNELLLKNESLKWLDRNAENKVQLSAKCDDVLFKKNAYYVACGQMVGVFSDKLKINREIRATAVKRYLENNDQQPYRYELTLSDFLQGNGFKQLVDDVKAIPTEIESSVRPVREWTKRSWADVMETMKMMFDPEGDYFTDLIKPLVVHTAQLIVGTNSQQFDLIGVKFIPNADDNPNYFKSTAGSLVHFTINENGTTRTWNIPASSHSLNNAYPYYIYAKCQQVGTSGTIIATTSQIKLQDDPNYYHFWVGVLNTPQDGVRSWNPNYGYTEIAGQQITTGLIKDKYARLVIDLINATITAKDGAKIRGMVEFFSGGSYFDLGTVINLLNQDIDNVETSINTVQTNINNLDSYIDGAFADGIVDEAEAKAIEKYLKTLDSTMAQAESTYNKLYANSYLEGTAKSNLSNTKTILFGSQNNLKDAILAAIADGKATATEKSNVDSKFNTFNTALGGFQNAVEDANKAIQDKLDALSTAKVNDLVFGGVNLISNSDKFIYPETLEQGITATVLADGTLKIVANGSGFMGFWFKDMKYFFNTVKPGDPLTLSYWAKHSGFATGKPVLRINPESGWADDLHGELTTTYQQISATKPYAAGSQNIAMWFNGCYGTYYFSKFKVERGNKPTDWSPAPADYTAQLTEFEYLKTALQNSTTIDGGLVLTTLLKLGAMVGATWIEKAGINGAAKVDSDVVAWFGSSLQQAIQSLAPVLFRMDGSGQLASGNIKWDKFGNPEIKGEFIGRITSNNNGEKVIIDPGSFVEKIQLINKNGKIVGSFGFYPDSSPVLLLRNLNSSGIQEGALSLTTNGFGFSHPKNPYTLSAGIDGNDMMSISISDIIEIGVDKTGNASVIIKNLPTSPTGLASGTLWRNGTSIQIVP